MRCAFCLATSVQHTLYNLASLPVLEILGHIPFYLSQLWVFGLANRERNLLEEYQVSHILRKTRDLCSEWEKKVVKGYITETTAKIIPQNQSSKNTTTSQGFKYQNQTDQTQKQKIVHCILVVILYLMEYLLDHVSTCSSIIGLLISLLIFHQLVLQFPNYDLR